MACFPSLHHLLQLGLKAIDIRSLKEEDQTCVICSEEYSPKNEKPVQLPCGHIAGEQCIIKWLLKKDSKGKTKNSCPICRATLYTHDDPKKVEEAPRPAPPVRSMTTQSTDSTMSARSAVSDAGDRNTLFIADHWQENSGATISLNPEDAPRAVQSAWILLQHTPASVEPVAYTLPTDAALVRQVQSAAEVSLRVLCRHGLPPKAVYDTLVEMMVQAVGMDERMRGTAGRVDSDLHEGMGDGEWLALFGKVVVNLAMLAARRGQ